MFSNRPETHASKVYINGFAIRGPGIASASALWGGLISQQDMSQSEMPGKDKFDHHFFRTSAKMADSTDPQVRLLLELTYEALTESGVSNFSSSGIPLDRTGVYVGSSYSEFHSAMLSTDSPVLGSEHLGGAGAMLAGSISRQFGFKGPSMKVDTACSSGLQAFDIACNDIRSGRTNMAIVGASNMIMDPQITAVYERMTLLSGSKPPACKPFSESADGYARQEAVVVMVLSNEEVVQKGNLVSLAEVLGNCSMSAGGSGSSATALSTDTLMELCRRVYAMAESSVSAGGKPVIRYVECHATGTKAGDEIETSAIAEFVREKMLPAPLLIGSAKSNLGHSEASSGLVGLAKVLLSLEAKMLPKTLHYSFENRNRRCQGLDTALKVVEAVTAIKNDDIALINSFGFSGSCVQVMVRGIPNCCKGNEMNSLTGDTEPWTNINPIHARSVEAVATIAQGLTKESFSKAVGLPLLHGGTLGARAFITPVGKDVHTCDAETQQPIWIVFSGIGSNWWGMGSELYRYSRSYREAFDCCNSYLLHTHGCNSSQALLEWQQTHEECDTYFAETDVFRDALDATVCLVVLQICLIDVIRTVGLTQEHCCGFIGHSCGEIAAGYFDLSLSRVQALDVAVARGQAAVSAACANPGAMRVVIGLNRPEVEHILADWNCDIEIACENGPTQFTLSGSVKYIDKLSEELLVRGHIHCRSYPLNTFGVAYHHSTLISDDVIAVLREKLDLIFKGNKKPKQREKKWFSTSDISSVADSDYYIDGFTKCVQFDSACKNISMNAMVIECGPSAMFRSSLSHRCGNYFPLLQRGESSIDTLAVVYGYLFLNKVPLFGLTERHLPKTIFPAFEQRPIRELFCTWDHSSKFSKYSSYRHHTKNTDEFKTDGDGVAIVLDLDGDYSWLRDHVVAGQCLMPAALYLSLIWEHAALLDNQCCEVNNFKIHYPVDISELPQVKLLVIIASTESAVLFKAKLLLRDGITESIVASSDLLIKSHSYVATSAPLDDFRYEGNARDFYHRLGRHGYEYGCAFRAVSSVSGDRKSAVVKPIYARGCNGPNDTLSSRMALVCLMDCMIQLSIAKTLCTQYGPCRLPVEISQISLYDRFPPIWHFGDSPLHVHVADTGEVALNNCLQIIMTGIELHAVRSPETASGASTSKINREAFAEAFFDRFPTPNSFSMCTVNSDLVAGNFSDWSKEVGTLRSKKWPPYENSEICVVVSNSKGFPGFIRSLQQEPGYGHLRGLHVRQTTIEPNSQALAPAVANAAKIFSNDKTATCLFVDAKTLVTLHECSTELVDNESAVLGFTRGTHLALADQYDSTPFCWKKNKRAKLSTNPCSSVVHVKFSSLNFRDAMLVSGKLNRSAAISGYGKEGGGLGLDFAGVAIVSPNSTETPIQMNVIGLGRDCITDVLWDQPNYLMWELGTDADLASFATAPCVYATAYYALCERGRMHSEDSVLVHCGAGGVGIAALHICSRRLAVPAAQLFVTCGNEAKKLYISQTFGIPLSHIGDSRSTGFKEMIRVQTKQQGVSIVLNSLSGALLNASADCLCYGGRLLEIGKSSIDISLLTILRQKDRQLIMVDLDQLMSNPERFETVHKLFADGLKSGEVVPLPFQMFLPDQFDSAVAALYSDVRIGKVLLNMSNHNTSENIPELIDILPEPAELTKQAVILVGGLGGLGLCLSEWLGQNLKEMCHIILCARTAALSCEQRNSLDSIQELFGTTVELHVGNFGEPKEVNDLLRKLQDAEIPCEVVGFINVAAAIKDCSFDNMTSKVWEAPFESKCSITENFSNAFSNSSFANITSRLRFFVCVSSVVCGIGNAGQTNYGCANSAMEEVVLNRVSHGLPGLCVRLGLLRHVGLATSLPSKADDYLHLRPLDVDTAIRRLSRLITGREKGVYTIYGSHQQPLSIGSELLPTTVSISAPVSGSSVLDTVVNAIRPHLKGREIGTSDLFSSYFDSLEMILLMNSLKTKLRLRTLSVGDLSKSTITGLALKCNPPDIIPASVTEVPSITSIIVIESPSGEVEQREFQVRTVKKSLFSVRNQSHCPCAVIVVFIGGNHSEALLTVPEIHAILPSATVIYNDRTCHSAAGALNSGVVHMYTRETARDSTLPWISFLNASKEYWLDHHLEDCARARSRGGTESRWVAATDTATTDFTFSTESVSGWLVHCSALMEAGLFDEALSFSVDRDMHIRLCDVLAADGITPCAITGKRSVVAVSPALNYSNYDADLFQYKHKLRMVQGPRDVAMETFVGDLAIRDSVCVTKITHFESQLLPFVAWNESSEEKLFLRRDTHETLHRAWSSSLETQSVESKMLVGIATSDIKRIEGLLGDLACMLNSKKHYVVVFVNSDQSLLADDVRRRLLTQPFRSHVICHTDRVVAELFPCGEYFATLPISKSRTVLQTFLYAATQCEVFDAIAVLDDDIRLPKGWGVFDLDEQNGDIFLGRAMKTPPNVTVLSMRTQLLDFVYALDSLYTRHTGHEPRDQTFECPSLTIFRNLSDQYYDISSTRWDHLEVPRHFEMGNLSTLDDFIGRCKYKILVGDPLAREAISMEEGPSCQRGGCMVLRKGNFHLMSHEQNAPIITLSNGRQASCRRSDTFWVQYHCRDGAKKAVAMPHLSFYHDNSRDSVPIDDKMRDSVALELIGAILCRPAEDRQSFAHKRTTALRFSIARIHGLVKVLRGRPYFSRLPALQQFASDLDTLFEPNSWERDVFDVIHKHVEDLKIWSIEDIAKRTVPLSRYCLDTSERMRLGFTALLNLNDYPSASSLRMAPMLPIPCLHRIHKDGQNLTGAHKVQKSIGMSLPLSEVEGRLRHLSELVKTLRLMRPCSSFNALVTMDDGFCDVTLLRPIFQELSDSLQPVICLPSCILRSVSSSSKPRHLPLTCLYEYCAQHNIDPEDASVLGNASRSTLKTLPEREQYLRLDEAMIPTHISTADLLSVDDLKVLNTSGWLICAHGPDHSDLTQSASLEMFLNELECDFDYIRLNNWAPWFAWPEGRWCARLVDAVVAKVGACTTQFGLSSLPNGEPQHPCVVRRTAWLGSKRQVRILVTGSSGFLGKHLIALLQAYGYTVFCYDVSDGLDILDGATLLHELRSNAIDVCVHLAAIADLNIAEEQPDIAQRINVEGTRVVLSCCDEVGVRLLFASTCCAYGNNNEQQSNSEVSPTVPTEIYAETKLAAEAIVLSSSRIHVLRHVVMRLATFYGPGMRPALATAIFLNAAMQKKPIVIHGEGHQTRCFTHVHDIAEGIRVIIQTAAFSGIINVTDDREVSVKELADIALKITGSAVAIVHCKDRKGQIRKSRMNNDRLRALGSCGWTPTISLEDGLRGCMTKGLAVDVKTISVKSNESLIKSTATMPLMERTTLPISANNSNGMVYVTEKLSDGIQLIAYMAGDVANSPEVSVRLHSECFFGDVLGSLKCDCGPQKNEFLKMIGDNCPGVLIYIQGHEGRGAGIVTKTRAYNDVDLHPAKHHNTALLDAGAAKIDTRSYEHAIELMFRLIRPDGEVKASTTETLRTKTKIYLYTNNRSKVDALQKSIESDSARRHYFELKQQIIPAGENCTKHNLKYLKEKQEDNDQSGLCVCAHTASSEGHIPSNIDILGGIETNINGIAFDANDSAMFEFFKENGFAVVRGFLSDSQISRAKSHHDVIMQRQYEDVCSRLGPNRTIAFDEFSANISQFRDLFLRENDVDGSNIFRELICDNGPVGLGGLIRKTMQVLDPRGKWEGVKLLHDHTISKPAGLKISKAIPLHQDRMFWPVDIPACSSWIPLTNVPLNGGCIEIFSLSKKSHLHHQTVPAIDFMSDETDNGLKSILSEDPQPVRWLLPMKAGDVLFFSSSTWHRSSPNHGMDSNRVAYIQTWVHPSARWRPDLVPWHPVNEHLTYLKPGDVLCGERHPVVGSTGFNAGVDIDSIYKRSEVTFQSATKQIGSHISMFDASDVVCTQIRNILSLVLETNIYRNDEIEPLVRSLQTAETFESIIESTLSHFKEPNDTSRLTDLYVESGCRSFVDLLSWSLKRIMISTAAYESNRSRNVFNSAYIAWWKITGEKWNHCFLRGKFNSNYRLCKHDVGVFLRRINVNIELFTSESSGKLALLKAIIRGCLLLIPFQNFTMLTRKNVTMDGNVERSQPSLGEVIGDMVSGIGGLCSTRNPFLLLLLRYLKYETVFFVAGTMCFDPTNELNNAHTALIVRIADVDYWVDIANGWPYLEPVPLDSDGSFVIHHPFVHTRLSKKTKRGVSVYVVEHLFSPQDNKDWAENYYFQHEAVDFDTAFSMSMQKHYNDGNNFGPFLSHLRLSMWSQTGGVMLRDTSAVSVYRGRCNEAREIDLDDNFSLNSKLSAWLQSAAFFVDEALLDLAHQAWCECTASRLNLYAAEKITVTGGFFDGTANGYIGLVTLWRRRVEPHRVERLIFKMVREYEPDKYPVINKGFAGASWYGNELYVCWPNRVAVVEPAAGWSIRAHFDNPLFNDLHHVQASAGGLWIANTGYDSIDHISFGGDVLCRHRVGLASITDESVVDIRSQLEHDLRRGRDVEHVNYVHVHTEDQTESVLATFLQTKRVVRIDSRIEDGNLMVRLPVSMPPHEGFIETVPCIYPYPLLWNSTVTGHVIASDPKTGYIIKEWNLAEYIEIPRGWTRGLCLLQDGFLVGSTAIRGEDAENWIKKHNGSWNFAVDESKTAVSFVPYANCADTCSVRSVDIMSDRRAKIFSLLRTPDEV